MKTIKLLPLILAILIALLSFQGCQQVSQTDSLSRAAICSPSTPITIPFTYNGAGEFCWETTSLGTNINSWNLDLLEVNGTAYTNTWVDSSTIPALNNKYVIHYKCLVSWGHFEIIGSNNTATPTAAGNTGTATRTATTRTVTATRSPTRTTTRSGGTALRTGTKTPTATASSTPTPPVIMTCQPCLMLVSGTVTGVNGQPVSGASIYLESTLLATTSATGTYNFSVSPCLYPASSYLYAKATGYQDGSQLIPVGCTPGVFNFILTPLL